jgi:hypothetical protein
MASIKLGMIALAISAAGLTSNRVTAAEAKDAVLPLIHSAQSGAWTPAET